MIASTSDRGSFRREFLRRQGQRLLDALLAAPGLAYVTIAALLAISTPPRRASGKPRLLWGARPITSLPALSRVARCAGHVSDVAVIELYATTHASDFDHILISRIAIPVLRRIANTLIAYWFFAHALSRYDIFHYFFDGGVLQRTGLWWIEAPLLRLCGKRLVLIPYGSDSFVYDRLPLDWRHALMINYPALGSDAADIEKRIRRETRYADVVVGSLVHVANLPRWDILPLTYYPVDTERLQPVWPRTEGRVRVGHAPNHRGAKGTEFIIAAVEALQHAGRDLELVLVEGRPHSEALELLAGCDVIVEQLVFGYALTAMEAMALGKVVITGIDRDAPNYMLFRRYSYLDELPAATASPETLRGCLERLLEQRSDWPTLGRRCRDFVERRHSFAACGEMWQAVYARIWHGEAIDLMNYYHPLGAGFGATPTLK
jgi:glycosyltransferase involved in cell wall biosynthesis